MYSRFLFQLELQRKLFSFIAILMMAVFLLIQCIPSLAIAQTEVPLEAQSGIIEKSLSQTAPKFEPPPETEAPKITNKNEPLPTGNDGGPKFFVKKIKLTGNTVISDEILMPIIDLGEGRDVDLMILNTMANKITVLYSSKGYLLARAFVPKQEILDDTVEMVITEGRINKVLVQGNKILSKENIKGRMKMVQEEGGASRANPRTCPMIGISKPAGGSAPTTGRTSPGGGGPKVDSGGGQGGGPKVDSGGGQGGGNSGGGSGGSKEGGSKEGGSKEGGSKEGGSKEGGSKEGGSKEGGSEEGGSEEGESEEGGSEEGGSEEEGSEEAGSEEEGSEEEGSEEAGSGEEGSEEESEEGSEEEESEEAGSEEEGSEEESEEGSEEEESEEEKVE